VDNDIVGTIATLFLAGLMWLSFLKFFFPPSPGEAFDSLFGVRMALLCGFLLITPLSLAYRLRRKWLASSEALLDVLRALGRQELALADGSLKDLRAIASATAGHSTAARNHARELIRRVQAAKSQHGPLPIPAMAVEAAADSLPVPDSSGFLTR
jgi:hypothetical protein